MSYFLRVFCKSDEPIRLSEITQFVQDGGFFEHDPTFRPEESTETEWKRLAIHFDPQKRPIVVHASDQRLLKAEIAELPADVRSRVEGTRQVVAFEVLREGLTDEAWEMLDSLQAHIAKMRDGIVYAPDEGLYDADLQRLDGE